MTDWPSGFKYRPIVAWPREQTARRKSSPFSTSRANILKELGIELRAHGAKNVVIQIALRESQFRMDGLPKANVIPEHPGVILALETPDGALSFPCDTFSDWFDNLLAIVRTMNKLRIAGTYGVTRSSEQYSAWRAIESSTPPAPDLTVELAMNILGNAAGYTKWEAENLALEALIRRAFRATHPDTGGSGERFQRVQQAAEYLRGQQSA